MVDPAPGCEVKCFPSKFDDMWIGELAERSGVAARTVRFYEEHGLLAPPNRTESGYREYDNETVDRLVFIKSAKSLGLTLDEIDSVLQSADTGQRPCQRVQAIVTDKLCSLDTQIAQLQALRERLSRLNPPAGTQATICPMIESASR